MADVFQEVDEALKKERMEKLWKRYGSFVIGGLVAFVLVVGVFVGYRNWNDSVNTVQTDMLFSALDNDDPVVALEQALIDLRPGHRSVALLLMAAKYVSDGDVSSAREVYDRIFQDLELPADFRDYALLMRVRADMAGEKANFEQLLVDLSPLSSDERSVWYEHALVEKALLMAHGNQDYAGAVGVLKIVRDGVDTSDTLRQRASSLIHIYELKSQE